jgi:NTP pyrophosphatase (non-canonical NTP hydrolase)
VNLREYQAQAERTLNSGLPFREQLSMATLGLGGEAGEVQELVKKALFHGTDLDRARVAEELGDVLWYLSALASTLGLSLDELAQRNLDKLRARHPHGWGR